MEVTHRYMIPYGINSEDGNHVWVESNITPRNGSYKDLTGQRFGCVTVIKRGLTRKRHVGDGWESIGTWVVKCDCGVEYSVITGNLDDRAKCPRCRYDSVSVFKNGDKVGCYTIIDRCRVRAASGRMSTKYKALCECGKTRYVSGFELKKRPHETCACKYQRHGFSSKNNSNVVNKRVYQHWSNIKDRCYNPNSKAYKHYGARGIVMCDRWLDFLNFLNDMGDKPEGCSLDRIDPDGPYSPENCRWANKRTQSLNRGFNKVYQWRGDSLTLGQWLAKIQQEGTVVSTGDGTPLLKEAA